MTYTKEQLNQCLNGVICMLNFDQRKHLAYNLNTKPEILDVLSRDEDSYVRFYVAGNFNTKPEILDVLSQDKNSYVRCCVAQNPNTKPEILDVLSRDKDSIVRCFVAENLNCPERAYKYIKGLELLKSLSEVST